MLETRAMNVNESVNVIVFVLVFVLVLVLEITHRQDAKSAKSFRLFHGVLGALAVDTRVCTIIPSWGHPSVRFQVAKPSDSAGILALPCPET